MTPYFRLRTDLERVVIDGFALPLGFAPKPGQLKAPQQGYTLNFVAAREDEPDTYTFHIVVSHERVGEIVNRAFELLPDEVFAIVEIGSRDAYRSTDTYISDEPVSRNEFLEVWRQYEPFLLEDGCIAFGANAEEPFVEVFLDHWKGIAIHVPHETKDEVEQMLQEMGLEEVPETWPDRDGEAGEEPSILDEPDQDSQMRSVLDMSDENSPDVDELLLDLRHAWKLELNIDPESNIDEGGRDLGNTLWHAMVIVDHIGGNGTTVGVTHGPGGTDVKGGYASIWATASSINQMEALIQTALDQYPEWSVSEIFTIDRVAFDERPDELADLRPRRREPQVHLITIEPWVEPE